MKLFSVSVVSVAYLGGQVLLVAVRYGWIVVDVAIVTSLLKFKFRFLLQKCAAVLSRSFKCSVGLSRSFKSVLQCSVGLAAVLSRSLCTLPLRGLIRQHLSLVGYFSKD